ncbi:hypothetical protein HYV82_02855 [Candidatus Woesearchaeota archaeon]|nr:hypothetical protein [Candidatus Woesearchaeota archaeon]
MIPAVRSDIITVLKAAEGFIIKGNFSGLRGLSDHTIHNSSIFQDEDSISIAVVTYSLSKICESGVGRAWLVRASKLLGHARRHLERNEFSRYKSVVRKLTGFISSADARFRAYIQDVINQAQVRKGSRIYYHGISLARAADLLGVSQWELMGYAGRTQIIERYGAAGDVKKRLEFARGLF